MTHSKKTDLMKVPGDRWGRREYLLSETLPDVLAHSTEYVRNRYELREQLEASCWFMEYDLLDAPPGDGESLMRIGFFPWTEAQHELSAALDHALLGFHRASYDHQRRALELILVGAWFVSERTTLADAQRWMRSDDKPPSFSNMLNSLSKEDMYAKLKAETGWVDDVKKFYWRLCDIMHVRGTRNGIRAFRRNLFIFSGFFVPTYSEEALEKVLDSFVETISYAALLMALSNPVLLFGLPVEGKYGINGPCSGFFEEGQAEFLRALISERYRDFLVALAEKDSRVTGVRDHFCSRPDLTDQQLQTQIEDFRQEMKNWSE